MAYNYYNHYNKRTVLVSLPYLCAGFHPSCLLKDFFLYWVIPISMCTCYNILQLKNELTLS